VLFLPQGRGLKRLPWLVDRDRITYMPRAGERWFIAIPNRRRTVDLPDACPPPDVEGTVRGFHLYVYGRYIPECVPDPIWTRKRSVPPGRG
jgi:hypothetical protein